MLKNWLKCLHPSQPQTALVRDLLDFSLQKNPRKITLEAIALINQTQDLRTCDEFFGFRTISRGCSPREIVQLRK
ncbi:MAG: hypothetical protein SNJ81_16780, partial [Cyanobacteriota bacterium]